MRYDTQKPNDDLVKIKYDSLINAKFQDIKHDKESSSEELWCKIKHLFNTAANEVLGYKQRHKTGPWILKEILELSDQRKILKASRKASEKNRQKYNTLVREIKKKSKECKDK